MILLDIFSSFKLGQLIPNEQRDTLQQSLVQLASDLKHPEGCVIRVDHAPGFKALENDKLLQSVGIKVDFGRIKNKNSNPSIDKSIQEVEYELKCLVPSGGMITPAVLATALSNFNHRIRSNGLSAKEILLRRENYTSEPINFDDKGIQMFRYEKRLQNHPYSEKSKSHNSTMKENDLIAKGDIVHLKLEGSKHKARELYLVTSIDYDLQQAEIQKFTDKQLRPKKYTVQLSEIFVAPPFIAHRSIEDTNEEEDIPLFEPVVDERNTQNVTNDGNLRRSNRTRTQPDWLATSEIGRAT